MFSAGVSVFTTNGGGIVGPVLPFMEMLRTSSIFTGANQSFRRFMPHVHFRWPFSALSFTSSSACGLSSTVLSIAVTYHVICDNVLWGDYDTNCNAALVPTQHSLLLKFSFSYPVLLLCTLYNSYRK
ncbi:hypothetical protein KC19_VG226900 [Ceratodon purpureus]|uniref:Uncharacterized protein n=1 Tax=Ceratodon purpureus TaxID=3225 RepID=A0A8T0HU00_CERPU|nr:hypothetical protein KC19_VG226900 [Ceratodon purpureus]